MQITNITPKQPEVFTPRTVSITIESLNELKVIMAVFNLSIDQLKELSGDMGNETFNVTTGINISVTKLWQTFNNILSEVRRG